MASTDVIKTDNNPNGIERFIKFNDPKETVYTTAAVEKHYPRVGTEIQLPKHKAEKWIEKGYATAEKPSDSKPAKTKKNGEV
jgi:hypothetical protein